MAKIIEFKKKSPLDKIITKNPWEFRRAQWESAYFIQIRRAHWEEFDKKMTGNGEREGHVFPGIPPHDILEGGRNHTIQGIYYYRNNIDRMREVYYLAGLIDCMINQTNPLLRSDLIRDMYKKVTALKNILGVNWYGHMDRVLFTIDPKLYSQEEYRSCLSGAPSMKALYRLIREGTDEIFEILSAEYIFFTPGKGE